MKVYFTPSGSNTAPNIVYGGTGYHVGDSVFVRNEQLSIDDDGVWFNVTSVDANGAITGVSLNGTPYLLGSKVDETSWSVRITAQSRLYITTTTSGGVTTKIFEHDYVSFAQHDSPWDHLCTSVLNIGKQPDLVIAYASNDGTAAVAEITQGSSAGSIIKFSGGNAVVTSKSDAVYQEYQAMVAQIQATNAANMNAWTQYYKNMAGFANQAAANVVTANNNLLAAAPSASASQAQTYATQALNQANTANTYSSQASTNASNASTYAAMAATAANAAVAAAAIATSSSAAQTNASSATSSSNAAQSAVTTAQASATSAASNASSAVSVANQTQAVATDKSSANTLLSSFNAYIQPLDKSMTLAIQKVPTSGTQTGANLVLFNNDSNQVPTGSAVFSVALPEWTSGMTLTSSLLKIANVAKNAFSFDAPANTYVYKLTNGTWALAYTLPRSYSRDSNGITTGPIYCWRVTDSNGNGIYDGQLDTNYVNYFDVIGITGVDSISDDGTSISLYSTGVFSSICNRTQASYPAPTYAAAPTSATYIRSFPDSQVYDSVYGAGGNPWAYGTTSSVTTQFTGPILYDLSGPSVTPYWPWFAGATVMIGLPAAYGVRGYTTQNTYYYIGALGAGTPTTVTGTVQSPSLITNYTQSDPNYAPTKWVANSNHTRFIVNAQPVSSSNTKRTLPANGSEFPAQSSAATCDSELVDYHVYSWNQANTRTNKGSWVQLPIYITVTYQPTGSYSSKPYISDRQRFSPFITGWRTDSNTLGGVEVPPTTPANGAAGTGSTGDLLAFGNSFTAASTTIDASQASRYVFSVQSGTTTYSTGTNGSTSTNTTIAGPVVPTTPTAPSVAYTPSATTPTDTTSSNTFSQYAPPPAVLPGNTPGKSGSYTPTTGTTTTLEKTAAATVPNGTKFKTWAEYDTIGNPNNPVKINFATWGIGYIKPDRKGRYGLTTTQYQVTMTGGNPTTPAGAFPLWTPSGTFGEFSNLAPATPGEGYTDSSSLTFNVSIYTPPAP
jgi:hypothetical protein